MSKACDSDVLEEIIALMDSGPLVVFCAHHDVTDLLANALRKGGRRIVTADGRLSAIKRADIVDEFQEGGIDCLIAGMDAMGEGVTLTRASRVVFLEAAWKSATFQQARDRLHRIGQASKVHALYMLAPHALDHCLHAMVTYKAAVASAVHEEDVQVQGVVVSGTIRDGKLIVASEKAKLHNAGTIDAVSDAPASDLTIQPAANDEIIAIRLSGYADAVSVSDNFDYSTLLALPSKGALRMRNWRARQGESARRTHASYMREWRKLNGK